MSSPAHCRIFQWAGNVYPILASVPVHRLAAALAFQNFLRSLSCFSIDFHKFLLHLYIRSYTRRISRKPTFVVISLQYDTYLSKLVLALPTLSGDAQLVR